MVEFEILDERENILLNRKEIRMRVIFGNGPTPTRNLIREMISKNYGISGDLIIIDHTIQRAGDHSSISYLKIYKDKDSAMLYEPDYELLRNGLKTKGEDENAEA